MSHDKEIPTPDEILDTYSEEDALWSGKKYSEEEMMYIRRDKKKYIIPRSVYIEERIKELVGFEIDGLGEIKKINHPDFLTEKQTEIYFLRFFYRRSPTQISQILGISRTTVRNQLFLTAKKIFSYLEKIGLFKDDKMKKVWRKKLHMLQV